MSSCEGSVVSKHCAYALRSGGICALCLIPTYIVTQERVSTQSFNPSTSLSEKEEENSRS